MNKLLTFALVALGLFGSTLFADYASTVMNDNPIAYYRFEDAAGSDTLTDSSGNNRHSIELNEVEFQKTGIVGNAAEFFGGELQSSIVLDLDFDPSETNFTIESWLYTTGVEEIEDPDTGDLIEVVQDQQVYIAQKDGDGLGRSDMLISANRQLGSFIGGGTTNAADPEENDPVSVETWYHFVMSYNMDDEELSFYVDGQPSELNPQFPGANGVESATGEWVIGSHKNQGIQFFTGLLDEIAFYDYQLTDAQVLAHFEAASDPGIAGDFDGDGVLGIGDINSLTTAAASGTNQAEFDLNGDGSVNQEDIGQWVRDVRNTWIGDANLDGEFNSSDFVAVFTAGLFETGNAATWENGDWNGDGVFGSGDFVAAFTDGGFELGPKPAAGAQVPEPNSLLPFLAAMLVFGIFQRRK